MHEECKRLLEDNNAQVIINLQTEEYEVPGHFKRIPIFSKVKYVLNTGEEKEVLRFRMTGDSLGFSAIEKENGKYFSRNFMKENDRTLRMIGNYEINSKELRNNIIEMVCIRQFRMAW